MSDVEKVDKGLYISTFKQIRVDAFSVVIFVLICGCSHVPHDLFKSFLVT